MEEGLLVLYSGRQSASIFFPKTLQILVLRLLQVLLLRIKDQEQLRLLSKTCYHQKTRKEREAVSHANLLLRLLPSALPPSGHAHYSMNLAYTVNTIEITTSGTQLSLCYIEDQAVFILKFKSSISRFVL